MSESVQRRSLLKMTAGATAVGWLWQGGSARAAEAEARTVAGQAAAVPLDTLVLGDRDSESAHGLAATRSDVVRGGLDQTARVLNAPEAAGFWGGSLAARMACRPEGATYITVKLWGSERGAELGRLQLFAEGKQVGHYHLGAVDPLDIATDDPRSLERFFFHTLPLPRDLTAGKSSIALEVRAMGSIAGYANTADAYYKDMEGPSRTIYRLYTHDEPYFDTTADDVTGALPAPAIRTLPGSEIVDTINTRVLTRAAAEAARTSAQTELWYLDFLARAYNMSSTNAYQNIAVPPQIARSLDAVYWKYVADSSVMTGSTQQWMGLGRAGLVMLCLADDLEPLLDEPVLGSPYGLSNPGFEFGTTGWKSSTWSGSGTASRDTTEYRTGHASAKITIPGAGTVGYTTSAKLPVDQGTYTYGAWVKTDGVGSNSAYLDILFYDADGAMVGTDNKFYASSGTHDWEHVTATVTTPGTATQVAVSVRLSGTGTAWFDDLTMTEPAGSTHTPVTRRAAWAQMLLGSREYWRRHIPQYTNQAIICSIGLYLADRGLTWLGSADAWGETKARDYLYQAVGLVPWLGPETADGTPTKPLGGSYHQVTKKGISKELGYAGSYGELQEWLSFVYDAVTVIGGVEDSTLRDHLVKMAKARAVFRYPSVDRDGYRTMRLETMVGWRDTEYPGKVAYDQDAKWDGHALKMAAQIKDPDLTSYAQQSLTEGQAFLSLEGTYEATVSARTNLNLLSTAADYAYIRTAAGSGAKLPMSAGAPDFVFSDEENGLVAIKHGEEILFASLYWRARWGVNRLARVHHITPDGIERSGTVWQDVKYVPDGRAFTEPDWVNWEFTVNDLPIPDGGFTPPGDTLHQAFAGQVLPLSKAPDDTPERDTGVESPYAGRASFYRCQYGSYLIAMNTTESRSYTFTTKGFGASTNLVTGAKVSGNAELCVKPGTTVVLRRR
ncbi:carbohydrate binding domain-containing protein [Streptomyces justiciae]|uniref:Tat pathway signal protein n=1 Tax=Streptomyces justiciae TaxID=2780140 RepID=UPI001881CE2C|nr:Tat pathway signal protein [Streptomyces justiciae]MBE8476064.1 Tat pathway signal protein [Streptomyces justiciae]MCW8382600.1 Tat pathway signal protein [Streptomyces justiciae]